MARSRLVVDSDELRLLSPSASPGTIRQCKALLNGVTLEIMTDRQAVLWGHDLQIQHGELVSRTLELSQAPVLRRVSGYVTRMTDILASIDLEAVAGNSQTSGVAGYFRRMNRRVDSVEELTGARDELDQLVRLMGDALEELLACKETLARQEQRIDELAVGVEASALAAQFMSAGLTADRPELAQRLMDRSMSLTQTLAQIRGNGALRAIQIEQPLRLIAAIQNVALVMVPGWLGSIAALGTMIESRRKPTPTETGELAFQLRNILQQLKA